MNHWVLGPFKPVLSSKEVQIWRIPLPIPEADKAAFQKKLSLQELMRMNAFRFQTDKERFLVARGGLRDIISRYLNIPAKEVNFDYTAFGKPYLKGMHLQFNLSHSADYILYAFSYDNLLGIDVEQLKENIDYLSLAETICSRDEYEKFLTLTQREQILAFYRCWTRKEAVIKMIGRGLSFPLKQLEVGFSFEDEIKLLGIELLKPFLLSFFKDIKNGDDKNHCVKPKWQLEEILLESSYVAAIAAEKRYQKIFLWDWQAIQT